MANSIAYVKSYTSVLDEVYKRASVSSCLNSPRRMARAGRNAKEIMVPKIEVTGLGDYTRNVGYKTGSITYGFETKTFGRTNFPERIYHPPMIVPWRLWDLYRRYPVVGAQLLLARSSFGRPATRKGRSCPFNIPASAPRMPT